MIASEHISATFEGLNGMGVKHRTASLWSELARIRRRLDVYAGNAEQTGERSDAGAMHYEAEEGQGGWNPATKLRETFGLSDFELDLLLLCAGLELDRSFTQAINASYPGSSAPSFGLAIAALEQPHWSALSRMRPLRYWRLIEMGPGPLLQAPLSIDERILQFLLGVPAADDRLELILHALPAERSQNETSEHMREAALRGLMHWRNGSQSPVLLMSERPSERIQLFREMCAASDLRAWVLDGADLPETATDRERLARAFTREAALWPAALLVRTHRLENTSLLGAWLQSVHASIAVEVESGSAAERLGGFKLAAPRASSVERKQHWHRSLGPLAEDLDVRLDAIVDAFELDAADVDDIAKTVLQEAAFLSAEAEPLARIAETTWQLSRSAARRSLDELATHVENAATWDELVLPEAQTGILRQIAIHARQASRVHSDWGFASRYVRGLGLSALFAGPSGTGKTMAAGVLARELDRDLYQIDLATVVSKYIGETEKHLRKIFDAAERSGAILLFDEADALFGKRSQVRDSHDRYANLEVSYLLQRMESYRGIAILTTNMQNALDPAFQRRLRFVVQFPFPDATSRERIWRKVFPPLAPLDGLDYEKLAQLNITGGSIRNVALLAAFLAAEEDTGIRMAHLLQAAQTEYTKLDKPLTPAEIRGWL